MVLIGDSCVAGHGMRDNVLDSHMVAQRPPRDLGMSGGERRSRFSSGKRDRPGAGLSRAQPQLRIINPRTLYSWPCSLLRLGGFSARPARPLLRRPTPSDALR
jgi:hypothetical protein